MYPVGVLFGFGFDTASSIALLAITALAKKRSDGRGAINQSDIIVLPLLFTCGMTLVDSIDSIIMLYSYAGFPQQGWNVWERGTSSSQVIGGSEPRDLDYPQAQVDAENSPSSCVPATMDSLERPDDLSPSDDSIQEQPRQMTRTTKPASPITPREVESVHNLQQSITSDCLPGPTHDPAQDEELKLKLMLKHNTMSSLSITLTLVSILVGQFGAQVSVL